MKTIPTKLTVFLLVLTFVFSFAACAKDDTAGADSDPSPAPSSSVAEPSSSENGTSEPASSTPSSSAPSSSAPSSSEAPSSKPAESKPQQTVTKPSIVGTWKTVMDMSEAVKQGLEQQDPTLADIDVDFKVDTVFTFKNNGKYTMTLDRADLKTAYTELMKQSAKATLEQSLQGSGMTLNDYLAEAGITLDELVEQSIDIDALVDAVPLYTEGDYKLSGNKLYTYGETPEEVYDAGKYTEIELSEKTMKFKKIVGYEESEVDYMVPLTLTRA